MTTQHGSNTTWQQHSSNTTWQQPNMVQTLLGRDNSTKGKKVETAIITQRSHNCLNNYTHYSIPHYQPKPYATNPHHKNTLLLWKLKLLFTRTVLFIPLYVALWAIQTFPGLLKWPIIKAARCGGCIYKLLASQRGNSEEEEMVCK